MRAVVRHSRVRRFSRRAPRAMWLLGPRRPAVVHREQDHGWRGTCRAAGGFPCSTAARRPVPSPASLALPSPPGLRRTVLLIVNDEAIALAVLRPMHRSDTSPHVTAPPLGKRRLAQTADIAGKQPGDRHRSGGDRLCSPYSRSFVRYQDANVRREIAIGTANATTTISALVGRVPLPAPSQRINTEI